MKNNNIQHHYIGQLEHLYLPIIGGQKSVTILERTNTNGRGVLQIPEAAVNDLLMPAIEEFTVHSLRSDHEFNYFIICNTKQW